MSIIEKALDKSDSKGAARRERQPAESRRDEQGNAGEGAQARTTVQESPPKQATSGSSAAPRVSRKALVEDEPKGTAKRPDFPRKTLKHVELDFERLAATGIITPGTKNAALVEQFRIIKRPLLRHAAPGSVNRVPNGNLVLVTSAVPREGKTYTAINLAMSIASELDHTVLLVDADPDKSDISRMLGIHEPEGLMDYVEQPSRALSEFLVKTDMEKLTVLPSGRSRANNTELFASEDMSRLADQMARRHRDRIVILDSPPLLVTSGARVLSHLVGQTVLVVEAVRTPQSAILEALELLKGIPNVGLVLNKSRDGGGSGIQYGPYGGYGSTKKA